MRFEFGLAMLYNEKQGKTLFYAVDGNGVEVGKFILSEGVKTMADRRFIISKKKGMLEGTKIITDTETGVQYLYAYEGYAGGLTLLVDKDWKPLLDKNYEAPAE